MNGHSTHAFAEKVALITDCTGAVGRAIALQLALNGAFVILGIPDDDKDGREIAADIADLSTLVRTCSWKRDALDAFAKLTTDAIAHFGRLDLVANIESFSSMRPPSKPVTDASRFTDGLFPKISDRPKPRIVNIFECPDRSTEIPDLDFIETLTTNLAEAAPKHFRFNSLIVDFRSDRTGGPDHSSGGSAPVTAPDDVARVVLFLLSGESTAVNGQTIRLS